MKKMLTSLIVLAMFVGTGAAFADDTTALTTKNYVDSGLRAVYTVAKDAQDRVRTVETTVEEHASSITNLQNVVNDHADSIDTINTTLTTHETTMTGLQDQIDALSDSDTTYTSGTGITISGNNNTVSVTGLDTTTQVGNTTKRYLYQNGQLTELEVANTWNADILTAVQ